jgi:hypothetical protein
MTIKNGDKSAMPNQALGNDGLPTHEAEFGLTKREMMAMHMMSGLLSKPGHSFSEHNVARDAVRAADALLAALESAK